jgi:hypothetical protein
VDAFGLKNKIIDDKMKNHFRILYSLLPDSIGRNAFEKMFAKEDALHTANKTPGVSHLSKQLYLKKLATDNNISILVETGTYLGDMLYMLAPQFSKLFSVELSEHFYQKAVKRFKGNRKITLLQGDSGTELAKIVPQLNEPAIFWLDGHYSGGKTALGNKECPIFEELSIIFESKYDHVIVVDDARLFVGQNDYPTIEALNQFLTTKSTYRIIAQENDAILIKK